MEPKFYLLCNFLSLLDFLQSMFWVAHMSPHPEEHLFIQYSTQESSRDTWYTMCVQIKHSDCTWSMGMAAFTMYTVQYLINTGFWSWTGAQSILYCFLSGPVLCTWMLMDPERIENFNRKGRHGAMHWQYFCCKCGSTAFEFPRS